MKTGSTTYNSTRFCVAAILIAALIGTFNSLALTYHFGNGAFQADYFRHFLYNVMPILDGTGSLSRLFTNHHASPLLHLHQIFTSYVLKSSLRVDAYVGIILFFVMAAYVSVAAFRELSLHTGSQFFALIIAISIGLVMTGLTAVEPISWPLIYLQGYLLCLGLLVSISTYLLCAHPQSGKHMALYLGSVVFAIFLHTSFGLLFFVASIPAVVLRAILQRSFKLLALVMGIAILAFIWNNFLLPSFGQMVARNAGNAEHNIAAWFAQIPWIAAAFGRAVAAGFHGDAFAYAVDKEVLTSWQMAGLIGIAIAYAAATLWALLSGRKVMIAGVIMLAIGLGAMAALLSRGNGTFFPSIIYASRYILQYKFAGAAFLWSGSDALGSALRFFAPRMRQDIRNFLLPVIALTVLGSITALQLAAFHVISQEKESLATNAGWNELSIYMLGVDSANTFNLQYWQSGNNGPAVTAPVIIWLARNEVNVFSQDYRGSAHLSNYKQARSIYQSSQEVPLQFEIDRKNCIEHPAFAEMQAWNANIESSINGSFALHDPSSDKQQLTYFIRAGVQNIYGTWPPDMPFHLCLPANVTVISFSHLSALNPAR
jgi:hypothetical protein